MKFPVRLSNALLCDDGLGRSEGLISQGSLMIRRSTVVAPNFQKQNNRDQFLSMRHRTRKSIGTMFPAMRVALGQKIRCSDCPIVLAV